MTIKSTLPDVLWAGTEHSLALASEAHARVMAGAFDQQDEEDEDEVPFNYSVQDRVGVISIKGSLTNRDAWYNRYMGVTSYADIRRAMIYAAKQPDIKAILLDIDSGGGSVSGVGDTGNLIRTIDTSVKPVYAFSDGVMCSAAYWLGCSAREVYSSNVSTVGSIGVIATHMEYSKMLKEQGIGVTVVRAGEFKALLNSVEPATKAAIEQLQGQLNSAYGVFLEHVADCRNVTVDNCDKVMAQGREFFGKEALAAGLVDGIETFDSVMSKLNAKLLDNEKDSHNNSGNYQRGIAMSKKALTEQELAAIAAGVSLEAEVTEPVVEAEVIEPVVEAAVEVTESEEKNDKDAAVVSFLQAQVKDKDAEILALSIDLKGVKDKVASMEATHNGLVEVVAKSVKTMKVAMGNSAVDLSGMSAESLLAEYAASAESFTKAFKTGGVAAVDAASSEANQPQVDPRHMARVNAARFVKQGAKHG